VPTLNVGDLIVVQGIPNASEIKAAPYPDGDVIVFYKPGTNELIVHRAINKYQRQDGTWLFYTKGDANAGSYDPWSPIPQDLVVGKVIAKVPWVGHIPLFIRTPLGILLIITIFVVLIVIDFVFPSKKDENETKEQ